jgi:hypothetical protein
MQTVALPLDSQSTACASRTSHRQTDHCPTARLSVCLLPIFAFLFRADTFASITSSKSLLKNIGRGLRISTLQVNYPRVIVMMIGTNDVSEGCSLSDFAFR